MKDIKGIGFSIPSEEDDFIKLDSFSSLADIDIAIFSCDLGGTNYSSYDGNSFSPHLEYEGKKLYNKESSSKIIDHKAHWRKELTHFVKNGGTLFIILCQKVDSYIYTGTKDVSGTGRNQKSTYHVSPFCNYDFLPFNKINYSSASGKNILPQSPIIADLFKNFKSLFDYDVYIASDNLNTLFSTKKNDRILGGHVQLEKGHVVFLPNINFDTPEFYSTSKTKDDTWSKEAYSKGKLFKNNIAEIDKILRSESQKSPKPTWIDKVDFELASSTETRKQIEKLEKEIEIRKEKVNRLSFVLAEQEEMKDLLFETGKPLENAVLKALQILGFSAENYDDGELELDQIIISPEGVRYVGECEGKDNKDIDVSKFRQLLDGLNADFEKENVIEKAFGVLFGNAQRFLDPADRSLDFTAKCKSGAKREKIALIRTFDLFKICKVILENKDSEFAKKCRDSIQNQLGDVVVFPEYK